LSLHCFTVFYTAAAGLSGTLRNLKRECTMTDAHTITRTLAGLAVIALLASTAQAQSNVAATAKFCYAENAGWMNWRDAGSPQTSQGVQLNAASTFLQGFVWAENVGYINLGDGSPANGTAYANPTSGSVVGTPDFGVNIDPSGKLSGYAWGENIGWINFGVATLASNQQARLQSDGKLRGYAWGENIGWINLDSTQQGKYVSFGGSCDIIDFNGNGVFPEDQDVIDFFNVLAGGVCSTGNCQDIDFNNNEVYPEDLDVIDFFTVLAGGPCSTDVP